jgi:hypothetical protein
VNSLANGTGLDFYADAFDAIVVSVALVEETDQ